MTRSLMGKMIERKMANLSNGLSTAQFLNSLPHVRIRDVQAVDAKLEALIRGGAERLQVLSDFDWTITKFRENGVLLPSTHGVMEESQVMPRSFVNESTNLLATYHPIEFDPNIPDDIKIPLMREWWTKTRAALLATNFSKEIIKKLVSESRLKLRDGFSDLTRRLEENKIPLLVFSAGIGDILHEFLKQNSVKTDGLTIISNRIDWNEKGKIIGYKNDIIHSYNKNEALKKHLDYFESQKQRNNAMLLGDSLGDLRMIKGVENIKTCLTVGFLNDKVAEREASYVKNFDIVLVEDETMNVAAKIIDAIL